MNGHKNARLTLHSRQLICKRLEDGWTPREVATSLGVSVRTVYKWRRRYREEGLTGLSDRSSRPREIPHRLPRSLVDQIIRLRRACRMTGRQIAARLRLALSTVHRYLRAWGMARLSALQPKPPVRRYERKAPGDLLHLDIKAFNRFDHPGHRVTGSRLGQSRNQGKGKDFVHVAIDDFSRLAYVEILSDEKGQTCAAFLLRAATWFKKQGILIRQVMTDNGGGYISKAFAASCRHLSARHLRTRPYTPKTNGKAERFIKTLIHEWAYARLYRSSKERADRLPAFIKNYNLHRPHASLNYKPPASRVPNL